MFERQVFVLRVWRDAHGELRASLKTSSDAQVTHFQNLEMIVTYLKDQFAPGPAPTHQQPGNESERR